MIPSSTSVTIFRIVLSLVIFISSCISMLDSARSETISQLNNFLIWIGAVEAIAALMLLIRKTQKLGSYILLGIFLGAMILYGPADQLQLSVYTAGIIMLISSPRSLKKGA